MQALAPTWSPALSAALALATLAGACSPPNSGSGPAAAGAASGQSTGGSSGSGGTGAASPLSSGGFSGSAAGSASGEAAGGGAASGGSGVSAGTGGLGGTASTGTAGSGSRDFCATRAGLALCEDFEARAAGPALAAPPWAPAVNGDGQVLIDDSVAHSGTHSLKVHGSGFSTFLVLSGAPLPAVGGRLYVRMFLRLPAAMTGGHNTFLVADTAAAPGAGNAFRLGEMNAMLMYTVSGDTHGALANQNFYTDNLPGAALRALEWGCVEVVLDHQKPEIQVALDGEDVPDLHHTDWATDAYDTLRFGFEKYAGPESDVWYDDIALGTAPIGCN